MENNKEIEQKYPLIEHYRKGRSSKPNDSMNEDFPASPGSIMPHSTQNATRSHNADEQSRTSLVGSKPTRMSYRQYQQNIVNEPSENVKAVVSHATSRP